MNYLKNFIKSLGQQSIILYLQIQDKELTCVLFKKASNTLRIKKQEKMALESTVIINGIIYNPTTLAHSISQFTTKHGLCRPKAVLCFAGLANHQPALQQLATLQTALCTTKTPLRLLAIIAKPLILDKAQSVPYKMLTDQQDLLKPFKRYNQHSPAWWLGATGASAGVMILLLHSVYTNMKHDLAHTTSTQEDLLATTKNLEQEINTLNQIKQSEQELAKRLTILKPPTGAFQFSQLLTSISRAIPSACWLESLNASAIKNPQAMGSKHATNTTSYTMAMQGKSTSLKAITTFIANLQKIPSIKAVDPATIKMVKKSENQPKKSYFFKLSATLKV
ncbi:PilN domain-containing protein [Candidatus Babeliales bacterium]|nr:PilN domain-containing protein [Candidatus Babeliales bacterium]